MDTISRENNSSMLPVGGIIIGVLALLIGGYAAISLSKANKALADLQPKIDKIDAIESAANSAAASGDKANRDVKGLEREVQNAVNQITGYLTDYGTRITKMEEAAKKAPPPAAGGGKKGGGEVVAGPNEYIVKAGDASGAKIARDHGIALGDLMKVNPDVNWNSLKPGQKLKMPVAAKK